MGGYFSKFISIFYTPKKPIKVFIGGLDAAGKTTILYQSKLGQVVPSVPTVGFNVQQIKINKNITIVAWDVGGGWAIRQLFHHYYDQVQAFIWVVDCTDYDRVQQMRKQFQLAVYNEKLKDAIVLVFANKQDLLEESFDSEKFVIQSLNLNKLTEMNRQCTVVKCSGNNGNGLKQGLNWVAQRLEQKLRINQH